MAADDGQLVLVLLCILVDGGTRIDDGWDRLDLGLTAVLLLDLQLRLLDLYLALTDLWLTKRQLMIQLVQMLFGLGLGLVRLLNMLFLNLNVLVQLAAWVGLSLTKALVHLGIIVPQCLQLTLIYDCCTLHCILSTACALLRLGGLPSDLSTWFLMRSQILASIDWSRPPLRSPVGICALWIVMSSCDVALGCWPLGHAPLGDVRLI